MSAPAISLASLAGDQIMSTVRSLLTIALGLGLTVVIPAAPAAEPTSPPAQQQKAADSNFAELIGDPADYLARTHATVADARAGKHGRISKRNLRRLDSAEIQITRLLEDNPDLDSYDPQERVKFVNAHETITDLTSGQKQSRLVCKRIKRIGTRMTTTQCMTREQLDARERAARESVEAVQRNVCVPGEGKSC